MVLERVVPSYSILDLLAKGEYPKVIDHLKRLGPESNEFDAAMADIARAIDGRKKPPSTEQFPINARTMTLDAAIAEVDGLGAGRDVTSSYLAEGTDGASSQPYDAIAQAQRFAAHLAGDGSWLRTYRVEGLTNQFSEDAVIAAGSIVAGRVGGVSDLMTVWDRGYLPVRQADDGVWEAVLLRDTP